MSTPVLHPATAAHKESLLSCLQRLEQARDKAHDKALHCEDDKALLSFMRQYFIFEKQILQLLPILHQIDTEGTLPKARSAPASKAQDAHTPIEAHLPINAASPPPCPSSVPSADPVEFQKRMQQLLSHLPAETQQDITLAVDHVTRQYIQQNRLTTESYEEVLWYQLIRLRDFLQAHQERESLAQPKTTTPSEQDGQANAV